MTDISLFEEALDKYDVPHRKNGKSIVLKTCFHCGNDMFKVWMFKPVICNKDPTGSRSRGTCWICGTKVNSYKYLLNYATEREVRKSLGFDLFKSQFVEGESFIHQFDEFLRTFDDIEELPDPKSLLETPSPIIQVPEWYMKVSAAVSTDEAVYARSRGVIGSLQDEVYIDTLNRSVVFPLWNHDETLSGFQERYLSAREVYSSEGTKRLIKCKTTGGVKKSKAVIICGDTDKPACLVEGPFDAVAAVWFGYCGICTSGATPSREQVQMAASYAAISGKPLYIGYDTDKAGQIGARTVARICDSLGVKFARLTPFAPGEDFSSMLTNHCGFNMLNQNRVVTLKGMVNEDKEWKWDLPF